MRLERLHALERLAARHGDDDPLRRRAAPPGPPDRGCSATRLRFLNPDERSTAALLKNALVRSIPAERDDRVLPRDPGRSGRSRSGDPFLRGAAGRLLAHRDRETVPRLAARSTAASCDPLRPDRPERGRDEDLSRRSVPKALARPPVAALLPVHRRPAQLETDLREVDRPSVPGQSEPGGSATAGIVGDRSPSASTIVRALSPPTTAVRWTTSRVRAGSGSRGGSGGVAEALSQRLDDPVEGPERQVRPPVQVEQRRGAPGRA